MYMLGDLNEDLLKVNRLEQILNKLNLYQLIKEHTGITQRSKTLIIITHNRDSCSNSCRNICVSIADHHAVSSTINLRKQRMTPL